MKPSIRKAGNRWVLTRPAFGFATSDEVTLHESWKAAKAALLGDAVGSAGPIVERASGVQRMSYPPRGQSIRMEETRMAATTGGDNPRSHDGQEHEEPTVGPSSASGVSSANEPGRMEET